jgi:hypothetical protein
VPGFFHIPSVCLKHMVVASDCMCFSSKLWECLLIQELALMILPAALLLLAGTMQIGCSVSMHQVPCFFLTCRKDFSRVISLIFWGRDP